MSNDPVVLSAPVVNAELAQAVSGAIDPQSIRAAVYAEAEKQALAVAADKEKTAADQAAATAATTASGFRKTEVIGGREFDFEAETELELATAIANAYRVAYAVKGPEVVSDPVPAVVVPDAAAVAAEAQRVAEAKADLDLKFKRGEISTAEYLEQSGAVRDYLAAQGLPIESIKATVEKNQNDQEIQSWKDAGEQFVQTPAGADWPGGAKNLEILGMRLVAMNLLDATDKVAAMAQAYGSMKEKGLVFPGDSAAATTVVSTATTDATKAAADKAAADATAAALLAAKTTQRTAAASSSMFGASSGVGATTTGTPAADAGKVNIDPNASPAEILDAWKKAQLSQGKNLNDAFVETFAGRR